MFRRLRQQWKDLTKAKPGQRFQNRYCQRKKRRPTELLKPLYLVIGSALVAFGVVLLAAPGPGLLMIFMGAAMIAEESLLAAKALDRAEVKVRALLRRAKRAWQHA